MYDKIIFLFSEECHHFKLEDPDFSLSKVVCQDIKSCAEVWELYEEFYQGFQEKAKEDWITFRYDFVTLFSWSHACVYSTALLLPFYI